LGKEAVVMDGAVAMVIDSPREALAPRTSLSCTLKLKVPAAVGVPLRAPPALRVSPGGSGPLPAASDQVYGGVPPACASAVAG
jgi:hypothetical protein